METKTNHQPQIGRFSAGVAGLIWRPSDGKYLLLQRSPEKDFGSGAWECVTGRVDQGEGFEQAIRREIREELGIEIQLDFIIGTMHFYRGPAEPVNELLGVQYGCSIIHNSTIHLSAEHTQYRWVTFDETMEVLPKDHWLLKVIQRAESIRTLSPPGLLEEQRANGFEL